jgi:hypothetical protein
MDRKGSCGYVLSNSEEIGAAIEGKWSDYDWSV